ncbi:MAG: GntR family transcriptional regulator [Kangiellaceae bacterium]|nr:GntR family transcriptional regulator [Kangiellaceae bacterium]
MNKKTEATSKTLADLVYQKIRTDIISGELKASEKLRLSNLCKKYDIGMSPLREALARLTGDALVVTEGQRGFWVAPLSIEELDDITNVRALLESEALQQSIQNSDEEWKDELSMAFKELTRIEGELKGRSYDLVPEWEEANKVFHEVLVSRCQSQWMKKMIKILIQQSERYRRISLTLAESKGNRNVHDEHEAIFHAAIQGNILKACRLIEVHLNLTTDNVRQVLEESI